MDYNNLKWVEQPFGDCGEVNLRCWTAELEAREDTEWGFGIDPGRNFGMACYYPNGVVVAYSGTLPESKDYSKEVRYFLAEWPYKFGDGQAAVVEGASYNDNYGQVMLEGIRKTFEIVLEGWGMDVRRVAPSAARKFVFGNGRVIGKTVWKRRLNGNAADAAVLAMMAGGYSFTG